MFANMNKIKKVISDFFFEESGFIEKKKILLLGFFAGLAGLNSQSVYARTAWNPTDAPIKFCKIDSTTVGLELNDMYCFDDPDQTRTFNIEEFSLEDLKKVLGISELDGVNFVAPPALEDVECSDHLSSDCCHESDHFSCHTYLDFGTEVNHKNALELTNSSSKLEATHAHAAPDRSFSQITLKIDDHCSSDNWCHTDDNDHVNTCGSSGISSDLKGAFK